MTDLIVYTSELKYELIFLIGENFESFELLDDRVVFWILDWIIEGEGVVEYI